MHPTHSIAGPHAVWEWALVVCAVLILVWVLYLGVKYTFWPGEDAPDHIKRKILEGDAPPRRKL